VFYLVERPADEYIQILGWDGSPGEQVSQLDLDVIVLGSVRAHRGISVETYLVGGRKPDRPRHLPE
jgi:hypothetical protein